MFIVSLNYKKDISEVEKHLKEHIDFLDKYYLQKKFICSGRKNPRTGGIIFVNEKDEGAIINIVKEDPFYKHDIAEYEFTEFIPTKFDENFACFINDY